LREVVSAGKRKILNAKEGDETKDIEIIEREKYKYPVDNPAKSCGVFLEVCVGYFTGLERRARDE
jgi:hypothetical protein